ncbi:unnamed protein product [Sphenostylis stenocarpa]|uniref:Uncharacterized protein n=1 Tax=Sphenostylis stenocarpa TaxID=92480 RepID=A0AA86SI62_9FABA|nr:unnamed protein product [Sphenostylis stenocarpa]
MNSPPQIMKCSLELDIIASSINPPQAWDRKYRIFGVQFSGNNQQKSPDKNISVTIPTYPHSPLKFYND